MWNATFGVQGSAMKIQQSTFGNHHSTFSVRHSALPLSPMHPILSNRRRLRAFAIVWAPIGTVVSVLPYWWVGGPLEQAWPLIVWGEALAVPVLASWYVCRFAPINDDSARVVWRV